MIEQSLVVLKKKTLLEKLIDMFLFLMVITAVTILILSVIIITKKMLYPNKVPDIMGYKPFIVLTGSMDPIIKSEDLVIVKEINPEELKEGDIIAFRNTKEDVVLIHRIVGKETTEEKITFKTKGDNNETEDKFEVDYKNIEGIYLVKFDKIGAIAMFIRSPQGLIISVLSIVTIFFIWQLIKALKREKIVKSRLKQCEEALNELKKEGLK